MFSMQTEILPNCLINSHGPLYESQVEQLKYVLSDAGKGDSYI